MPDKQREIVELSVEFAQSKKAEGIIVMDLRGLTDVTDYFVICDGTSEAQIKAITDAIVEGVESRGYRPWHVEGYEARQWILIDFVDVVIHIFDKETRRFYALERLWGDAEIEEIPDEAVK